ncbi:unnamed protein product [Gordionus sp. m RMFG-2023]
MTRPWMGPYTIVRILKSNVELMNASDDKNCEVVSYNEELNAQENHLNISKLLNTIIGEENKNYDADFKRIKILNDETKMVELGSHRENIMPSNPNISAVIDKVGLLIEKDNELTNLFKIKIHLRTQHSMISLPETHAMIQKMCRDFAQNELSPIADKLDQLNEFPHEQH